jgi:hypothetical protein
MMSDGQQIEQILDKMRDKVSEKEQRKREGRIQAEERRQNVLHRITNAAKAHGVDLLNLDIREFLADRLRLAQDSRISHAEAIASLAEIDGDFISNVYWWDIQHNGVSIWKNYVVAHRVLRADFKATIDGGDGLAASPEHVDILEINIRRDCAGGFVAEVSGDAGKTVGVVAGEDASPIGAAVAAYLSYFGGLRGEVLEGVPPRFLQVLQDNRRK